jgi:2'-5' RNA ligase
MAKRLFLAVELPPGPSRDLAALDPGIPGLRWLPGGGLHLTIAFLGNVEADRTNELIRQLSLMKAEPFELTLRGLSRFGHRGRPPVIIVAEIASPPPELFFLWTAVREILVAAGLPTESRPFHPHITVGRGKQCPEARLDDFLRRNADTGFGTFRVDGLSLFSSELTPQGARHTLEFWRAF